MQFNKFYVLTSFSISSVLLKKGFSSPNYVHIRNRELTFKFFPQFVVKVLYSYKNFSKVL